MFYYIKMENTLSKEDIQTKYQAFKETDEFKEILKEMKIDRPDIEEYILEMYIFGWYVQEKLNQKLEESKLEKPKTLNIVTAIDVCHTEDEWKEKYPLNEIIPVNVDGSPFKLEEVKVIDNSQDTTKVKEIHPDLLTGDLLLHGQIIKCVDE